MVQFASYSRRVLCKTRLIFPRINGPNMVLSGNTEVRKGVSRFVLCVPPVHRAILVVSKCSIQSEYLNNKQFDGRKLKTDS